MKPFVTLSLAVLVFLSFGCSQNGDVPNIDGHWRAVWISQGGEVPSDFVFKTTEDGRLEGEVHNSVEVIPFSRIERIGSHINLYIDGFESLISADISPDGQSMIGNWSKRVGAPVGLPFQALKGDLERFPIDMYPPLKGEAPIQDISGSWKYIWEGGSPDDYMVMTCRQEGDKVTASVRSPIGDWRWMEGIYRNGRLRLSLFNGTWVFLLSAEMDAGGTLHGTWVKSANMPYKWSATREEVTLTDPFTLSKLTNDEGIFRFSFPLADSPEVKVSHDDPRFEGRPLVVAFTTTGCPNGHDNAALISKLYKDYHDRGLEVLFINYEFVDELNLIQTRVKRFREMYDLPFPIAYSLAKNKAEAGKELPDLERFIAHPTTFFLDANGRMSAIHTGMDGPGTGEHHVKLEQRYRSIIESLLKP